MFSLAAAELFLTAGAVFRRLDLKLYETTESDIEIVWEALREGSEKNPRASESKLPVI